MAGRPPTYHAEEERPVSVSLRIPKALYVQAQHYAGQRRLTLTELLLDGLQMRLETPTDPRELFVSDESNTVLQQLREELKRTLLDELRHDVAELLASAAGDGLGTGESVSLPPAPPHEREDNVPQEGMKQCRSGHAPYPASRAECPDCVRERKRRQRERKAQQETGLL